MDDKDIKVTGERSFDSGAVRDPNKSKGRYDLLSPMFMSRLAKHTQKGGQVRGDRNWEAGMPMDAVLDCAIRHLFNFLEGDRSEDHLAASAWNIMNLIHTEEQIERGNLPASLAEGLPDYTEKPLQDEVITIELDEQDQLTYTINSVEDMFVDPSMVDQRPYEDAVTPYENYKPMSLDFDTAWDLAHNPFELPDPHDHTSSLGSHTHTVQDGKTDAEGKSCFFCLHASPVGGPIPLSERCDTCRRLSNWKSMAQATLEVDG